jgi:large subunit ribosomal protein L34
MFFIIPVFLKRQQLKPLIKLLITCGYVYPHTYLLKKFKKTHNYITKIDVGVYTLNIALSCIIVYIFNMSQTYQPNKRKRAKSHGFLVRAKTPGGRKVTQARRQKGRAKVSISK